jgi:Family of unknown function (DUF5953)
MPNLIPRELVVERAATGLAGLAPQITGVCRALARGRSLSDGWSMGDPPAPPVALDETAVDRFLRRVVEPSGDLAEPCWFTAAGDPPPTAAFNVEAAGPRGIVQARCALSDPPPDSGALAKLVRDVAEELGAYQAYIEDDVLLLRYFSRRATERARAAIPPDLRHHIPDPPELDGGVDLDLLVAHDYDRLRVPVGVFWINYWSAELVATLGHLRVRNAGWARVIDAARGALVLVATDEPLDPDDPAHLERLRTLLDQIRLRETQESLRHR